MIRFQGLRWLWGIHTRYPVKTAYTLVVSAIEAAVFTIPVSLTARAVGILVEDPSLERVINVLVLILGVAVIQAAIYFSVSFINEVLAHRVTTDITEDLFVSLQQRSLTYHDKVNIGEIMGRATGDTRSINIGLSPAVRTIIAVVTIWGITIYQAFTAHSLFGWILAGSFAIFLLLTIKYTMDILDLSTATLQEFARLSDIGVTSFSGIRELKNYVAEPWMKRKFAKQVLKHMKAKIMEGEKWAVFYPMLVLNLFAVAVIAATVYYSSQSPESLSVEKVVLLVGLVLLARAVSEELHWTSWMTITMVAASQRVYDVLTANDPGNFSDGTVDYDGTPATIEFRNVWFQYEPSMPMVLKDISFRIEENQTVVIVGTPGSGKSTLAKLVQRLYLPTKGEVLIGERRITDYTNRSLRKNIATVEQDIFLFNDTVLENIRFGKPDATFEEVQQVAKLAQAHDFIMQLPNQYSNIIGEGGVKLSGGQAQRIAIARALLMNPSILIMDDGASALDAKTEIQIQKAIDEVLKTRTTLITTHRLSIIAKADLILIFDKGTLVGMGSHEELIRKNTFYRRLFEKHYALPPMEGVA